MLPQIDESNYDKETKGYLRCRIGSITKQFHNKRACEALSPDLKFLLRARQYEDRLQDPEASAFYLKLYQTNSLMKVGGRGVIRTKGPHNNDDVELDQTNDSQTATCTEQIRVSQPDVLIGVLKRCDAHLNALSVIDALADKEWKLGFRGRAIERLEQALRRTPFAHRLRHRLLRMFQETNLMSNAEEHVQFLRAHLDPQEYMDAWKVGSQETTIRSHPVFVGSVSKSHQTSPSIVDESSMRPLKEELKLHGHLSPGSTALIEQLSPVEIKTLIEKSRTHGESALTQTLTVELLTRDLLNEQAWIWLIEEFERNQDQILHGRLLNRLTRNHPHFAQAHYSLARLHHENEQYQRSREALTRALSVDPENNDYRVLELQLVQEASRFSELTKLLRAQLNRQPNNLEAYKQLAVVLLMQGELQESEHLHEWLSAYFPTDAQLKLNRATALVRLERSAEALKIIERVISEHPNHEDAWALYALILGTTERIQKAYEAFNEAVNLQPHHLRLRAAFGLFLQKHNHFSAAMMQYASILYRDPNNADALQQLNALRIITGEHPVDGLLMPSLAVYLGENNDIEFPENWRLLPGAVLKDIREVTVMPSGHLSIVHTRDIWIQNPLMAQKYSQVRIPFYVQYPPKVEFAELILPNGDKKSIGGEQWRVENPNRNTTLFGDSRNLVLLCEGLEAGSILRYRVQTTAPPRPRNKVWWDSYVLANEVPTALAEYSLSLEAGETAYAFHAGCEERMRMLPNGKTLRRWSARNVLPFKFLEELNMPPPTVFATSFDSWSSVDAWYHALFEPATILGEQLKHIATRIAESNEHPRGRLDAVVDLVERVIDYQGIEFGVGAYRPRPSESTWRRRAGDCKDMVALIVGLTRALGLQSHAVLVRPNDSGSLHQNYPSPGQFSHVIVNVKLDDGTVYWLDPTAELSTLNALPKLVRGAHAFRIDGQGGQLIRIPESSEKTSTVQQKIDVNFSPKYTAKVSRTYTLTGDAAGWLRLFLRNREKEGRSHHIHLPGFLMGEFIMPTKVMIEGLRHPSADLLLMSEGEHRWMLNNEGVLTIDHLLDPSDADLMAMLNQSELLNSPRIFSKETTLNFATPHRLAMSTNHFSLDGPLKLRANVNRLEQGKKFVITIRLELSPEKIVELGESAFVKTLQSAQLMMEQSLKFIPVN